MQNLQIVEFLDKREVPGTCTERWSARDVPPSTDKESYKKKTCKAWLCKFVL